jgi:hypothetical protein
VVWAAAHQIADFQIVVDSLTVQVYHIRLSDELGTMELMGGDCPDPTDNVRRNDWHQRSTVPKTGVEHTLDFYLGDPGHT